MKKSSSESSSFLLKDFPGFSARDLKGLRDYYTAQWTEHSAPEKRVGWRTAASQRVRLETLASVGDLRGKKILDVGCGLGALWVYLREQGIRADYTGVDLFAPVIAEAAAAHSDAVFETRNILARPFARGRFDFVFLSGVFNVKIRDNWEYMRALLSAALRQAREAVAFNALNAEAQLKEPDRFSVQAKDLVALGRRLGAPKVHLLDHYHHLDLTLFLYKK
ncbi:MAG: class I SAM-dependent methyltransferase [bacterium]